MPEENAPQSIVSLTTDEAIRLKAGLEKCFLNAKLFNEKEMEGLERTYDLLMGLS